MIFMSERKDILVTGCCGGMGSAICKKLIEQNYRVLELINLSQQKVLKILFYLNVM